MKCEYEDCINDANITVGTDDRDHHFCKEHYQSPKQYEAQVKSDRIERLKKTTEGK